MWNKRLKSLARGSGPAHEPLFAPLLFGVAAQIEAISPDEMALSGTRIRKNVGELRAALGLDSVFAMAPNAQLLAGLPPATGGSPDVLLAQAYAQASLDAIKQWQADSTKPVIAAAIDGPMQYIKVAEKQEPLTDNAQEAYYDYVGANLASMVRQFSEAGLQLLCIHDTMPSDLRQVDLWKSALTTACNVARFHNVPTLLVLDNPSLPGWPAQAIACPTTEQAATPANRPSGTAWPSDPQAWGKLADTKPNTRVITTSSEVATNISIGTLLAAKQAT